LNFDLNGKTALITGASGLLGTQHCEALSVIGCDIVLTDVDDRKVTELCANLSKKYPKNIYHSFNMDVSNESSIVNVVNLLAQKNLSLDILINNAAINPKVEKTGLVNTSRLESFDLNEWNNQLSVGLTGAFLCCKHFGQLISKNKNGGVILNISSDLSVIAPDQRLYSESQSCRDEQIVKPVTYSVIKTGLVGLTRYISTYWADKNVRCNSLSPGGVQTEQQSTTFVSKIEELIPLGRMASVNEYVGAIQFLCSDASQYMNGQNLVMDGGRSVW
jgi:NAD(P)-dependent dehydrogenase (short-subunit alcohol dehydrogenase family)